MVRAGMIGAFRVSVAITIEGDCGGCFFPS